MNDGRRMMMMITADMYNKINYHYFYEIIVYFLQNFLLLYKVGLLF